MPIFKLDNQKLTSIKELKFDLERDVQRLTEQNLEAVFGLEFVSTEFQLNDLRIDTLAYDTEAKAFVIIEYKRDRSFSVIDPGYAYLALMLNNKADFILEHNEKLGKPMNRNDIDWTQSRVIFVANSFTNYQQQAINFKDLPIELWEAKKYDNNTILYNRLKSPNSSESIKTITKQSGTISKVAGEVKKYSVDDLFKPGSEDVRAYFEELQAKILNLDSRITVSPQKYYVGYKIGWKLLVALNIQKSRILLDITRTQPKDLKDPEKKAMFVKDSLKHYGQYISRVEVASLDDTEYAFSLVRQAYERQYK